jgi:NAD(P)-dependent dehydrogenase (short-subunit alcohol dehydrogenase family)
VIATYLVTGANRGLGLELTRQLAEAGNNVLATARDPERALDLQALAGQAGARIGVERLDVASGESIDALRGRLRGRPIDTLINNAAVGGQRASLAGQDFENHRLCYEVNALAPFRLSLALLDNLRAGTARRIVNITSQLGSLTNNTGGGYHPYRASKACLNMLTRCLAAELAHEGFVCLLVHPGWVRTDMGGPSAPLSARESVAGILTTLSRLTERDNGRFYDYTGAQLPW